MWILQSHLFRISPKDWRTIAATAIPIYNQQLVAAISPVSKEYLQAMKDWHKLNLELFQQTVYRPGHCCTYISHNS